MGKQSFTLAELGHTWHYPSENLDLDIKRFHERALDCYAVNEEIMVDVRLHGMADKYRVFLENLKFPPFSKLMDADRRTNNLS